MHQPTLVRSLLQELAGGQAMRRGRSVRRRDVVRHRAKACGAFAASAGTLARKAGRTTVRVDLVALIGMARDRARRIDLFIDYFGEHRFGRPPLPAAG
jgi:hypothetical protein